MHFIVVMIVEIESVGLIDPIMCCSQLRFKRHLSVHKMFLNMWGEQNHSRHLRSVCQPSFYQIKPPLLCKNTTSPLFILCVLMRVSQI